jgi:hypothetical protein
MKITASNKNKIKEDEVGRECGTRGRMRNAYKILVRKPKGMRSLGRHR